MPVKGLTRVWPPVSVAQSYQAKFNRRDVGLINEHRDVNRLILNIL